MVCELSGACSYNWIYIGPDGETSQCGRAGDYNILSYGNLKNNTFSELMRNPKRNQLKGRQSVLPEKECQNCRFWGICHGGCPIDAYMTYNDFMKKSPGCSATKIFIEKYFEPITGLHVDFMPN
jgi:radical SAM protein with 4Fe4S-binding SPASM domain